MILFLNITAVPVHRYLSQCPRSYFGQVALDAVFLSHGNVPAIPDYLGLGLERFPSHRARWTGTSQYPGATCDAHCISRKAVDVVGQAGKPRTISGFQTHQTPVRMGTTERAELGTEQYIPFAAVLEGFVILAKNEGWEDEKMES